MICRDLDKSYAIILEEYLLELCISPFLTLLNFLARQRVLQHKKEKEKKCDYVNSFFSSFLMICRDLDKSYAIILEEYLLELCIYHFLTLLDFLARQRILQHKTEKEKKCDYVSSFFFNLSFLFYK